MLTLTFASHSLGAGFLKGTGQEMAGRTIDLLSKYAAGVPIMLALTYFGFGLRVSSLLRSKHNRKLPLTYRSLIIICGVSLAWFGRPIETGSLCSGRAGRRRHCQSF